MTLIPNSLQLGKRYCWWDGTIPYYFRGDAETAIDVYVFAYADTVKSSDTAITHTTATTDANGDYSGEISVLKATYISAGNYVLRVSQDGTDYDEQFIIGYQGYLSYYITDQLESFQQVMVYGERGNVRVAEDGSDEYDQFRYAFSNWNRDVSPDLMLSNSSGIMQAHEDLYVDYAAGEVYVPHVDGDDAPELEVNYAFRYFSEDYIGRCIDLVVDRLNAQKPVTSYTVDSAPREWDYTIIAGVLKECYKKVLLDVQFWKNFLIYADARQMQSMVTTLLNMAATDFGEGLKLKRRGEVMPQIVASYKHKVPIQIDGSNWKRYTIIGDNSNIP